MFRKIPFVLSLLLGIVALPACSNSPTPTPAASPPPPTLEASMPNPASVHCEQHGGKLELRQDATGGTAGVCVFSDGSECDEWAYSRGECKPGDSLAGPGVSPAAPEAVPTGTAASSAYDDWKTYRHAALGYSFQYPPDATIVADDPARGVQVIGPVTEGDNWPVFYFNHPTDREDYRPPDGVDLAQWMADHSLLMDERQGDVQIAGTRAIHTHFARSPQSYAIDRFFFAKGGQLYELVILHAGDKEDWELYNHFLASLQFE